MARPRADTLTREPHNLSLKVLRLSRPALAEQRPVQSDHKSIRDASTAFPNASIDQNFILTPALTLPSSFGAAYVGESFSCSLCANNELQTGSSKTISNVRLIADMQTPSHTAPLTVQSSDEENPACELPHGGTLQKIVDFDLKEEGPHVLTVTLTYTECLPDTPNRVRTFRKLYQFQAQPCLNVRTKATELNPGVDPPRYTLEAQIENVSDNLLNILKADLLAQPPFKTKNLNWDVDTGSNWKQGPPILSPQDIYQLAFLVEQDPDRAAGLKDLRESMRMDGRVVLGQISLEWSSAMGQKGQLTTGNLMSRKR